MPPKRKAKGPAPIVGVYELDLMNEEELRKYIEALREESERMRKSFANHQQEKREMAILLMKTQEEINEKREELLEKEVEYQRLLSESSKIMKSQAEKDMIVKLETDAATEAARLATFEEVTNAISVHRQAEKKLEDCLMGHQREIETCRLEQKFLTVDLKEKEEEQHADLMMAKEESLDGISEEYIQKYRDEMQRFYTTKVNALNCMWNDLTSKDICERSVAESCEKMTLYFKDLFWKNSKASSILKDKIHKLQKDINKLHLQLKSVEKENNVLLEIIELQKNELHIPYTKPIDTKDAELEAVTYENDVMQEKLRQSIAERDTLRARFLSAMRSICQKADLAYFLAEELLCYAQKKSAKH